MSIKRALGCAQMKLLTPDAPQSLLAAAQDASPLSTLAGPARTPAGALMNPQSTNDDGGSQPAHALFTGQVGFFNRAFGETADSFSSVAKEVEARGREACWLWDRPG